jgi:hypothetical protein
MSARATTPGTASASAEAPDRLDSGFDARWQCPDPAGRSGVPDLPDWACTED